MRSTIILIQVPRFCFLVQGLSTKLSPLHCAEYVGCGQSERVVRVVGQTGYMISLASASDIIWPQISEARAVRMSDADRTPYPPDIRVKEFIVFTNNAISERLRSSSSPSQDKKYCRLSKNTSSTRPVERILSMYSISLELALIPSLPFLS